MTSLAADDLGFIGCVHCRGLRDGRPGSATGTRPRATDEEIATNFSLSPAEICNNNNHNNDNQLKTAPSTSFHQLENLIFFFSFRFRLLVNIPTLLGLHLPTHIVEMISAQVARLHRGTQPSAPRPSEILHCSLTAHFRPESSSLTNRG